MKGINEIKLYLGSGNSLSVQVAKDILPSTEVDRDALFHVLIEQQKELATLKAAAALTPQSELKGAAALSASAASTSKLSVAANSFEPGAKNNEKKPEDASQDSAEIKRPEDKLCRSMWGKKQCLDRATCVYKHLALCHEPACYGNPELRKACSEGPAGKWHGHIRSLIKADKRRERLEADRRDFAAWQKAKHKGNRAGGNRGAPHHNQPQKRPQVHPVHRGQGQQAAKVRPKYPQRQKKWSAQARKPVSLGEYMPAPTPVQNAWDKPLVTSVQQPAPQGITGPGARQQQMQALLQSMVTLLQSGPC